MNITQQVIQWEATRPRGAGRAGQALSAAVRKQVKR